MFLKSLHTLEIRAPYFSTDTSLSYLDGHNLKLRPMCANKFAIWFPLGNFDTGLHLFDCNV